MLNAKRTYLRSVAALALGLGALGVPRAALAQDAQAESGFALQASLAARFGILATIDTGSSSPTPINGTAFQAGLSAGYKTGRLYLGLGLEFNNFTFNDSRIMNPGNLVISTTTRVSDFLIGPDVQFAILRSTDNRVELIADVALHFGHRFSSVSISPSPPPGPSVPTKSVSQKLQIAVSRSLSRPLQRLHPAKRQKTAGRPV